MIKRTIAIIATSLLCLPFSSLAWSASPKVNQGTFTFSGGKTEKKALDKAIEKVASKASFFFRSRIRRGLRKALVIRKQLTITMNPNKKLVIQASGKKAVASTIDGKTNTFQGKKGLILVTRSLEGHTLTEKIQPKGKKGYRVNRYTFSKDGKNLVLRSFLYLARLQKNIRFKLTYKKQ